MKTRKYNFQLICAITILVVNGAVVRGVEAPTIQPQVEQVQQSAGKTRNEGPRRGLPIVAYVLITPAVAIVIAGLVLLLKKKASSRGKLSYIKNPQSCP